MLEIAELYQFYSHQTAKHASIYAFFFFQKSEVSNIDLERDYISWIVPERSVFLALLGYLSCWPVNGMCLQ